MADFYSTNVYCNGAYCQKMLELVRIRGVVYLHHAKDACENSDKYFFPPNVALDEAWVTE